MILTIKQLKQHEEVFFPLTVAEAVLVKDNELILTLDTVLKRKIETILTPVNSGLVSYTQGTSIILAHSNSIEANNMLTPLKILYDNRGHIISTSPINKNILIVDNEKYNEYNGSEDTETLLGNDFGIDKDKKIILKWNNL